MDILLHAHSGLRYVVLILLLLAIAQGFGGWSGQKPFTQGKRKVALFAMISCHIQLLIGLILYFMGPVGLASAQIEGFMKNSVARFWGMEHIAAMVIAIALITIGHSQSKKASSDQKKHRKIALFYTLGLILILASIPWPFRELLGRGWF